MPYAFPPVSGEREGTVRTYDIPINEWLGLKFGVGQEDTFGNQLSRFLADQSDRSAFLTKDEWEAGDFSVDGEIKWNGEVRVDTAIARRDRKIKELRYQAELNAASHAALSAKGVAGFGAMMVGSMAHPVDFVANFIPFIGEEKFIAGAGGMAYRGSSVLGTTTADIAKWGGAFKRFPNLTASVINGTLGNLIVEVPVATQKWRDQADYGALDFAANIGFGAVAAGTLHGLGAAMKKLAGLREIASEASLNADQMVAMRNIINGTNEKSPLLFDDSVIARDLREQYARDLEKITLESETASRTPATESRLAPSGGRGAFDEGVKDSNGNGDLVNRYYGSNGVGGYVEWDWSADPNSRFPRIRWSKGVKPGTGKTLYLEALREAKERGVSGLSSDPHGKDDGGDRFGPTVEAIGVQDSLERRGLITVTKDSDGGRTLEITPQGERFLESGVVDESAIAAERQKRIAEHLEDRKRELAETLSGKLAKAHADFNQANIEAGKVLTEDFYSAEGFAVHEEMVTKTDSATKAEEAMMLRKAEAQDALQAELDAELGVEHKPKHVEAYKARVEARLKQYAAESEAESIGVTTDCIITNQTE